MSNSEQHLLVILKSQKLQTTFWKCQDQGHCVFINSKILLLTLIWPMYATNYYQGQIRYSSLLSTIMFSWTPCIIGGERKWGIKVRHAKTYTWRGEYWVMLHRLYTTELLTFLLPDLLQYRIYASCLFLYYLRVRLGSDYFWAERCG